VGESSKGTVLIADDADTFRNMLGDALSERGYDVIYAIDGLEALRAVRSAMPGLSLLVLDLLMPKMLGFDVLKELREDEVTRDVPVLVATGLFRNFSEIERVRSLGAKGFLDKSLPFEEILSRIESHIFPPEAVTRESLRAAVDVPVSYAVGDEESQTSTTFTISTSGFFIRTRRPERIGAHLEAVLKMTEREAPLRCRVRVVYAAPPDKASSAKVPMGMGVEIIEIEDADQLRLNDFVDACLANT